MVFPQGYHITFGVYLKRPPGSSRPHVDKDHNEFGQPLAPTNLDREKWARENAKYDELELTLDQRKCAEEAICDLAQRYGWIIHSIAIQRDHGHVVISAARDGEQLRDAIKAVATKWLNKRFGARKWWAEGGSSKYLWERDYFANAVDYVHRQREY